MYGFCSNRADLWIFEEGIPVFGNCVNGNEDLGCKKGGIPRFVVGELYQLS